jgi:hypothetical protein
VRFECQGRRSGNTGTWRTVSHVDARTDSVRRGECLDSPRSRVRGLWCISGAIRSRLGGPGGCGHYLGFSRSGCGYSLFGCRPLLAERQQISILGSAISKHLLDVALRWPSDRNPELRTSARAVAADSSTAVRRPTGGFYSYHGPDEVAGPTASNQTKRALGHQPVDRSADGPGGQVRATAERRNREVITEFPFQAPVPQQVIVDGRSITESDSRGTTTSSNCFRTYSELGCRVPFCEVSGLPAPALPESPVVSLPLRGSAWSGFAVLRLALWQLPHLAWFFMLGVAGVVS